MSNVARSAIVKGPGTVQLGTGPVIYSAGDIDSKWNLSLAKVPTSMFGTVDQFVNDKVGNTSFTPAGQITSAMITSLFPYLNPTVGDSIFTATDVPLKINSMAGRLYTLLASAVSKMPTLILSPRKTALGAVEFASVLKNNGDPSVADNYFTEASGVWSDATFATADVRRLVYTAAWGSIISSIITEDGWQVIPELQTKAQQIDENGTVDMFITDVGFMAKCKPVNLTHSALLTALRIQGTGAAIGGSIRQASDLVLTGAGSGLVVTLKDAALVEAGFRWGTTTLRDGEIGFVASRTESAGAFGAIATISAS